MTMSTNEIAKKLVSLCKEGRNDEATKTLYAEDVESVEAAAPPSGDRIARGLPAVIAKGEWWANNHVIHSAETFGPYPHGDDRFAVRFLYDVTHRPSGKRLTLDEVAVFHVANGKIVREEFFYPTA
jgi:ketosteroid isomerase-like protein